MILNIKGKLLLLNSVSNNKHLSKLSNSKVNMLSSKICLSKIVWKLVSSSNLSGIILAFLSMLGSSIAFKVKVPYRIKVMLASK
jgi:hypothetical protein